MIKRVKNKIHVEQLMENAMDWFNNLLEAEVENIILAAYMEAKEINDDDVEW
jgi:hypothetical protein